MTQKRDLTLYVPNSSRRRFLRSSPFATAALVLAAKAAPGAEEPDDPIVPLFHEWVAARREWYLFADLPGNEDWDSAETKAAEKREYSAHRAMSKLVPTTLQGAASLAAVLWDQQWHDGDESVDCQMILSLWRWSSGKTGVPLSGRMEEVN